MPQLLESVTPWSQSRGEWRFVSHLVVCSPLSVSVQVKIKGFNEKQPVLLVAIVTRLVGFLVNDKKFDVYKELVGLLLVYRVTSTYFL